MEYVSFRLGREIYALDVWHAREIVDTPPVSQLPNAPDWLAGLINLRGQIVPVVDLKKKFELGGVASPTDGSYVLIVDVAGEDGSSSSIGLLADAVLEVFDVAEGDLKPPPMFGARFSRAYLTGLVKRDESVVAVMNAARVLSDAEAVLDVTSGEAAMPVAEASPGSMP